MRLPRRGLLNCTDRCPVSLILVPSSRLPRSRLQDNGHGSRRPSFRSWCSGILNSRWHKPVLVSWPPIYSLFVVRWPGDGTSSREARSRSLRNLVLVYNITTGGELRQRMVVRISSGKLLDSRYINNCLTCIPLGLIYSLINQRRKNA